MSQFRGLPDRPPSRAREKSSPTPASMRAFTLTLALAVPFGLAACNAEPEQTELGEDIQEEVEGPIEEEVQQELGVETDAAYGYEAYDTDADGMLSEVEYTTAGLDGEFGTYDADGDGFLNDAEWTVYEGEMEM